MKKAEAKTDLTPSQRINSQIAELTDWRGPALARLRALIHEADSELVEEWKWDTGVYTRKGLVCAANAFKSHVKLNFFKGASVPDPHGLFNAGLDSKAMRSIDFHEGDDIEAKAAGVQGLIRAAIALNMTSGKKK